MKKLNVVFSLGILALLLSANAYGQSSEEKASQFKRSFQSMSGLETTTMVKRYQLTEKQQILVQKINDDFYTSMSILLWNEKAKVTRAQKITQNLDLKKKQLSEIFTKEQFASYQKDIDSVIAKHNGVNSGKTEKP